MSALNATNLGCSLTCKDIAASIRWYEQALGFAVAMRFENQGKLAGAVIVDGNIQIVLNQDDGALGWDRIKAAGGTLIDEPADRPWGARMFQFRDPDGFKLGVSTPLQG